MFQKFTTRKIVITGLLLALEILFQILGNYIQIGPVNINLSLLAVTLAAILAGPLSGGIVGFFNGILTLLSPSTIAIFMPINMFGTVITVLIKCTLGGILAGYLFPILRKKSQMMALIITSLIVPVVNTGLFVLACFVFFMPFLQSGVGETFPNIAAFLIFGVISYNFIFELVSSIILTPLVGNILLKREQKTY